MQFKQLHCVQLLVVRCWSLCGSRWASWVLHAHAVGTHHPAVKLIHCLQGMLSSMVFAFSGMAWRIACIAPL